MGDLRTRWSALHNEGMRRLGLVLVVGVTMILAACSSSTSIPPPSFRGPTISASLSEVCQIFNRAASPAGHSDSQLASLDAHLASLARATGDPSLRTLGKKVETQVNSARIQLQHPSSQTLESIEPAENPTLRQIGSMCMAKGLTPKYIYEEQ